MALNSLRLRRALSLSSSLLHQHFHSPKLISPLPSISSPSPSPENPRTTPFFSELQSFRHFRSSPISFSSRNRRFESDGDMEITPDTILFEGCDYNHWLITVDFPKDNNLSAEEKVQKYVEIAAGVFGSEEEAKKKIYACSTTTYEGFQVECSEETSEKFKENPAVVFVLPDSYIDPVNKEYGGDKYINGTIIPRPPPIMSVRRNPRQNRGPGEARNLGPRQNFGPQQNYQTQQNFGPPQGPVPQQNYGPPQNTPSQQAQGHQQNPGWPQNSPSQHSYGHEQNHSRSQNTPFQQTYGHQQNHGPAQNTPSQQTYGYQQNYNSPRNIPSQQTYGQHQNYGLPQNTPPQQTYGHQQNAPPQHNYGMPENAAAQQNYGYHPPQHNYGQSQNHPNQQNYGPPPNFTPQQSFGSPGVHSPTQQNYGQPGGIEGRGPTNAPIGGDQYHGGRGDFPQGNQMYTPSQGRSFNDHPGGAPGQEMGPAYGENNQRHGENQKISEVDQSSRFQGGEQRNFG